MASLNSNARTSASDVKEIIDTDLSDDEIKHHINAAAAMVDDVDAAGSVSASRLELIEEYLTAHIASAQEPRVKKESVGDGSWTYQGPAETTRYWDRAADLDPTGTLDDSDDAETSVFTTTDY